MLLELINVVKYAGIVFCQCYYAWIRNFYVN